MKISRGAAIPMISAGAMIYNQALTAAVGAALAAALGAEAYGAVNLARNIFAAALVLAPLGLDLGLQRYFAEAGATSAGASVLSRLRVGAACLASAVAAAAFLAANWMGPQVGLMIAVTMLGLPFAADAAVLGGAFRGLRAPRMSLAATYVVQPTTRALLIWPLWTALPGALAVVTATAISYGLAWGALAWRARDVKLIAGARRAQAATEATRVLRYSIVMGLSTFAFSIARTVDVAALSWWSTLADVGRYAMAQMLGLLVGMVGASLGQTLGARVAAAGQAGDPSQVREILSRNATLASALSSPLCVAVAMGGPDVDLLVGKSYQTPAAVYLIVAITQWVVSVTQSSSAGLTMTGRHALELRNNLAALLLQGAGCWVLVPRYGLLGAASATCLTMLALNVARQGQLRAKLGRSIMAPALFAPLAISALVSAPLLAVKHAAGFRAWWLTGIVCGLEVVGSFAVMLALSRDARRLALRGAW